MKFISLFAGVGGFDLALERLGHECVYANDSDKYCKAIYEKNFKRTLDCRSIRVVSTNKIPHHELLCGGFPCQSFSIAGKRQGFEDIRGTLFFEIARIIEAKHPRLLFLENVKGLLSHDHGRTFRIIICTLSELGYDLQWQVLNSKNFGVPQNRERVFIIGHLRGTPRPKVFPLRESKSASDRPLGLQSIRQIAGSLRASDYKSSHNNIREISMSIDANYHKGIDNHGQRTAIIQLNNPIHSNNRLFDKNGISPTLNAMQGGNRQPKIIEHARIRRLTPLECERLQGFPDRWTEGVSNTQRYKVMGNAVTVNVIYAIAEKL